MEELETLYTFAMFDRRLRVTLMQLLTRSLQLDITSVAMTVEI